MTAKLTDMLMLRELCRHSCVGVDMAGQDITEQERTEHERTGQEIAQEQDRNRKGKRQDIKL